MATITEDYVSFEIAKLLKDKGFDEPCHCFYEYRKRLYNDMDKYFPDGMKNSDHDKEGNKGISAPTLQMAMKWLREVHNLYVDIRININNSLYSFKIYSVGISGAKAFTEYRIKSYEAACEEAIKYCLEHLI